MLTSRTLINLSNYLENLLLKHPKRDDYGYVSIDEIIDELNRHPLWEYVEFEDIIDVANNSSLRRLQVCGNKIRLFQTPNIHTITSPISDKSIVPPKLLFYGTSIVGISRIKTFGIKSFKDKYIKLYPDKKMVQVLVHRNSPIVYIEINAQQAHLDGICFAKGEYNCYLTEFIASKYIQKII